MTRDPLDLLRAANPVPQPVPLADDEVDRRVAQILAQDGQLPAPILDDPQPRGPRRRWLPAGLVAAAVVVVAVVSAVVVTRSTHDNTAAGAGPVTCAVSTRGDTTAVKARLGQAQVVLGDRVRLLGGSARSFVTDPADGSIGFAPHGVSVSTAAQACRASTIALRPVVARPVTVDTRSPRTPTPLAGLTFAVPSSDAGYARLTAVQRTALATAMSHYDCSGSAATTSGGLVCPTPGDPAQVLLLGAALVTGPDVRSADAVAPDTGAGDGRIDWTVALSFRAAAARRVEAFTAVHHTSSTDVDPSRCGVSAALPCGDFLAIVVDGRVTSTPVTNAVLSGNVAVSARFDRNTAQALAADGTAASIELHPR